MRKRTFTVCFVEVGGTMNNDFELDLKVRVGRYNDKSSHTKKY